MATDRPRITPEGLKNLTQQPSTDASMIGQPDQRGEPIQPTADNMAVPIEPEPTGTEFDWQPVSAWSSNVLHRNDDGENWEAILRDIERISGLLKALQPADRNDRGIPPSEEYARVLNILYDALGGRRHELSVMILKIQGLPLSSERSE